MRSSVQLMRAINPGSSLYIEDLKYNFKPIVWLLIPLVYAYKLRCNLIVEFSQHKFSIEIQIYEMITLL